jgi:hypothetical protein
MDLYRNIRRASKRHGSWNPKSKKLKIGRGFCGKASNAVYSKNSSRRATRVQAVALVYRRPQSVFFVLGIVFNVDFSGHHP